MAAPTYPAAANLTEGSGTRSFSALSTNAGDWIVVGVSVENNGPTQSGHNVPTATGLTFTQQVATGTETDPGSHQRIFFFTAQDSAGGSRTVQVNPTGSFVYYARATVVRRSTGPGNNASAMTAQTVSLTRSGSNSGVFISVGDWSAGAVGSPTWVPGGSTTASQQGTNGTYIFGRWDDSGAAGSGTTGISAPSYTTPTVAALEMLGTADAAGVSAAKPGQTWIRRFHHRQQLPLPPLQPAAAVDLVIDNAAHAVTSDTIVLTQVHSLVINSASHASAADNITLTQVHVLAVNNATHGSTANNLILTQVHNLTIANAIHGSTADNLTLVTGTDLVIANAAHAVSSTTIGLTQVHILVVANSTHAQVADNLVLSVVVPVLFFTPPHRGQFMPYSIEHTETDTQPLKRLIPDIPQPPNIFVWSDGSLHVDEQEDPDPQQPGWARRVYAGGHIYGPLTQAQIAELTAAGYGGYLTTDPNPEPQP